MTVLQALTAHYEQLRARGEAPPYGYSRERIGYAIVLCDAGEPVAVSPLCDASGRTPGPKWCEVPRAVRRTSQPAANFLWDKTAYVFGMRRDRAARRPCAAYREHHAFRTRHETLLAHADDEGLRALLRFVRAWEPQHYGTLAHAEDMLDLNVMFRLEGDDRGLHERPAARAVWADHLARARHPQGVCLVTGARGPIARVHPAVRGVRGTHSAGAALVACGLDTFASYGKSQGANAPVSMEAAFAYTTALNALLAFDSRQRVRVGETTMVFWADATSDERAASETQALFSGAMAAEASAEEGAANAVLGTLRAIARGEPRADAKPKALAATRFHILGLAANVGRVSVRFWYVDSFGGFARAIAAHFDDLRLEPAPWRSPLSARRLLVEATRGRTAEHVPPALGAALVRSIVHGGRYPRTLLATVIARMRAEKVVSGVRAAICRACLARDHRLGFEDREVPVSLNRDETHAAYRLGRLFAVYERVQRTALGAVNATIRDRYFGAASATPATVFPLLARKCMHHLATLRKGERRRLAHWFEGEIDAILDGLGTAFPRSLRLEDQGRFALGYHHQRTWKRSSGQAADAAADDPNGDTE